MNNIITFNSATDIYNTIMSGQDLYCLDTGEFFTMFDDMYIAIYDITEEELRYYAKKCDGEWSCHIDDAISGFPTEVLEPNVVTTDGITLAPDDPEYDNADVRMFDYSNIIDMLSDLPGKQFIYALAADLLAESEI